MLRGVGAVEVLHRERARQRPRPERAAHQPAVHGGRRDVQALGGQPVDVRLLGDPQQHRQPVRLHPAALDLAGEQLAQVVPERQRALEREVHRDQGRRLGARAEQVHRGRVAVRQGQREGVHLVEQVRHRGQRPCEVGAVGRVDGAGDQRAVPQGVVGQDLGQLRATAVQDLADREPRGQVAGTRGGAGGAPRRQPAEQVRGPRVAVVGPRGVVDVDVLHPPGQPVVVQVGDRVDVRDPQPRGEHGQHPRVRVEPLAPGEELEDLRRACGGIRSISGQCRGWCSTLTNADQGRSPAVVDAVPETRKSPPVPMLVNG